VELFPEIGLDKLKFKAKCMHPSFLSKSIYIFILFTIDLWNSVENQKRFFSNYAFENGFDPTDANAWYEQSLDWIMSTKVFDFYFLFY